MKLIAVGKLKVGPERDLLERYLKRLRPKMEITEVSPGRGSPQEQKRREAEVLLAACPTNAFIVALDEGGNAIDSLGLSDNLQQWCESGRPLCFLIGGAEGLDRSVIQRADNLLSFGKLTWPHMLVRVMLAEQLFRSQAILAGHPYHKTGRP